LAALTTFWSSLRLLGRQGSFHCYNIVLIGDSKMRAMASVGDILPALRSLFRTDQGPLAAHARPFRFVDLSLKTLLIAFITVDLGFILLNAVAIALFHLGMIDAVPEALKITHDLALPEEFNYLKWGVIAVSLIWLALRDHWFAPFAWALVFTMILLDDSLQLHEQFGAYVASWSELPSSTFFYADDVGEMLAFGMMGLTAFSLGAILYWRSGAAGRALSLRYGVIFLVLGGFGVGVDAVHQLVSHMAEGTAFATLLSQLFGMVEEGGEMIVASFAAAMTLTTGHLRRHHQVIDTPVEA
jgi:hypothetical protein